MSNKLIVIELHRDMGKSYVSDEEFDDAIDSIKKVLPPGWEVNYAEMS